MLLAELANFVEKNWTRPYEVATSLLGLLLIFGGFDDPLATASGWMSALGADAWSDGLTTADLWARTHQIPGMGLLGIVVAAGLAALTMSSLPTRAGGTFWLFAAIAVYEGHGLGGIIGCASVGVVARLVVEWGRVGFASGFIRAAWSLIDVTLGAVWLPLVVLLWLFMPRNARRATAQE